MSKRAFIIAIENYAQMQDGLAGTLPGTHKYAVEFRDWLIGTLGLTSGDIFFCTEDPHVPGRTSDATRPAIKQELMRFKDAFKDATDDVYFYFSGHGFCYLDAFQVPTADVLLTADYVKRGVSADACMKLDEIQKWLKWCLGSVTTAGAGRCGHYYFIDACRNNVTADVPVASLYLPYDMSVRKKPPVFTLYSTTTGAVANVAGGFPEALLDGLNAKGKAKRWYHGTLAVLFDSLRDYIERRLDTQLEPRVEGGDGVIRLLPAPLDYTCAIAVKNAGTLDEFQVEVKNEKKQLIKQFTFKGGASSVTLPVDDYLVQVRFNGATPEIVEPATEQPADLYDDCALEFRKTAPPPPGGPETFRVAPSPPSLNIVAPGNAEVIVRGAKEDVRSTGALQMQVAPGSYDIETRDPRGVTVDRRRVTVESGEQTVDLTALRDSPLRHSLLGAIPGHHGDGTVEFSESIGAMLDQGLDLWLALIGAARIVGGGDDFSKLSPLPLATFDDLGPNDTGVYILAGFDDSEITLRAVVSSDWHAAPRPVAAHPAFPGLFEVVVKPIPASSRYVTVQADASASLTFRTCSLPMRVTLVTLTGSRSEGLRVQQFILPLKQFQKQLPQGAGLWLAGGGDIDAKLREVSAPLRLVRRCVEVQRAFARGQDLSQVMTETELEFLLYFKWFEPIVALMSAYELARRGELNLLPEVVANLRQFFPTLPDTEGLAKLAGRPWKMPAAPPLMLDGFQALDLMAGQPEVPPGEALDFRGPWTMWRGLVKP